MLSRSVRVAVITRILVSMKRFESALLTVLKTALKATNPWKNEDLTPECLFLISQA